MSKIIRMRRTFTPQIMVNQVLDILYKILEDISIQEIIEDRTIANRDIIATAINILEGYHED